MNTPVAEDCKIYELTLRTTGEKSYQAATTAEDACKQAGWLIGDCYVNPQKPRRKHIPDQDASLLVKIPCQTCPFQYTECTKPANQGCPTRPSSPDIYEWLKQAAESHLCDYVGKDLTKKDYNLGQKWVKLEDAIKELTPQPFSPPNNSPH